MLRLRLAGALWLALAAFSIAITVIFRVEQYQIVLTLALGVATTVLGVLMLGRQTPSALSASVVAGVAWVLAYGALAVIQADELAAWITDAFMVVAGGAIALLSWTAGAQLERGSKPIDRHA